MNGSVLVTGVSGFVGQALSQEMLRRGMTVRGAVRKPCQLPFGVESAMVGTIDGNTDWKEALCGVEVVIHLAARVHVLEDLSAAPLVEYLKTNLQGTANLAQQAARARVKRLVYVSSIKVNGEATQDQPFSDQTAANPQDIYAISKWEAEQALHKISAETGMEVVILRPPLVYGPGVKANFMRLLTWVDNRLPLPLASVDNLRSMIYLGNLVDALCVCVDHPAAAGKTYLVSDGKDVSTPDLIRVIADAMGKPVRLFPFSQVLIRILAGLVGKAADANRLLGSLRIDSSRICLELGWAPPYSLEEGIRHTVDWFKQR